MSHPPLSNRLSMLAMMTAYGLGIATASTVQLFASVTENAAEPPPMESSEVVDVENGNNPSEHESTGSDEGLSGRPLNVDQRPHNLRLEEREAVKVQHNAAEQLGREIEQLREDETLQDASIDELRSRAIERLQEAAEPSDHEQGNAAYNSDRQPHPVLVCFTEGGETTTDRTLCDPNQGRYFGEGDGIARDNIEAVMDEQFSPGDRMEQPMHGGPNLLDIIGNALHHLSGMLEWLRENDPDKAREVQEIIAWLGSILSRYANEEPSSEERMQLAGEIGERLGMFAGTSMDYSGDDGQVPGFRSEFDCSSMIAEMGTMMAKIPQIIVIFENGGISVTDDARSAANEAQSLFADIAQRAEENPSACTELPRIFELLDKRMRPSMEKAMMESQNEDIMRQIEDLMGEEMPHDMHGAPPMGDDENYYGPPTTDYQRSFHQDNEGGFGPPPGMHPDMMYPTEEYRPTYEGDMPRASWDQNEWHPSMDNPMPMPYPYGEHGESMEYDPGMDYEPWENGEGTQEEWR